MFRKQSPISWPPSQADRIGARILENRLSMGVVSVRPSGQFGFVEIQAIALGKRGKGGTEMSQ